MDELYVATPIKISDAAVRLGTTEPEVEKMLANGQLVRMGDGVNPYSLLNTLRSQRGRL